MVLELTVKHDKNRDVTVTLEPGLGFGLAGQRLGLDLCPWDLTALRKIPERLVQCGLGDSGGRETQRPNPWIKSLDIGT